MNPQEPRTYRFGAFRLDAAERRLTRDAQPVPLTPKAFDLLLYMARHPGRLLTKEELLSAVWPDSIVEEGNLSQNVFLLRKALTVAGEENRAILTIPGRGYQFAAPIEAEIPHLVLHAAHTQTTVVVEEEDFDGTPLQLPAGTRGNRRWIWAALTAIPVLSAAAIISYRAVHRPLPSGPRDIVVADFVNSSKDPSFDLTLRRALEIDLGQSTYFSILPQPAIAETLRMMGRQSNEKLIGPVAREVCQRNSGQAVLDGEIASLGSHYLITLEALDCQTGGAISQAKAEAESREEVLRSLDRVANQVRRQLGESLGSIKRFDVPIEQATTKSYDALVAFSKATGLLTSANIADAIPLLDRAIELDPDFALAYSRRGSILYNMTEVKRALDDHAKAYALSGGLSEREKLRVAAMFHWMVEENLERAADESKVWTRLYPRDHVAWEMLGNVSVLMGRYAESAAAAREAVKLDPKSVIAYVTLARAQKKAGLFEQAKSTCRQAFGRGLDNWALHSMLFQVAFAQNDAAALAHEAEWDKGTATEASTLENRAWAAATQGRIRFAHEIFRSAVAASGRASLSDFPSAILSDEAQMDWLAGYLPAARSEAEKVPLDEEIDVTTAAGVPAALAGGSAYAAKVIARLRSAPRRSVLRDQVDVPELQAAGAIYQKKAPEAVKILEVTQVYELREYTIPFLRGRAFLDAGMHERAVTEYRAVTDNPGIDPVSPMYPLAYLGLARAYRLEGKPADSRPAYEHFLGLWKDADADLPVLQEARREYAKLPPK